MSFSFPPWFSTSLRIALGFGVFIGFNMEWSTIEKNTDRLFEETGLADYKIYSSSALSDDSYCPIVRINFLNNIFSLSRILPVPYGAKTCFRKNPP